MRPLCLAIKCFDFRDLQFHTVNIRTNFQATRVTLNGIYDRYHRAADAYSRFYSASHVRSPYLDSHIYIDFFIWLFDIEARIRKLGVRVIITYATTNIITYRLATWYLRTMSQYCSTPNICPTTTVRHILQTWDNALKHAMHIVVPTCVIRVTTFTTLNNPRCITYDHQLIVITVTTFATRKPRWNIHSFHCSVNFLFHHQTLHCETQHMQLRMLLQKRLQGSSFSIDYPINQIHKPTPS